MINKDGEGGQFLGFMGGHSCYEGGHIAHGGVAPVSPIFLLTGLRIYTGEYKAQGPTLCPTEGRALRGPRALYSPV